MRRIKNFLKETIIWFMVFAMVCWSVSIPFTTFVKSLLASGGINAEYTDDGGAMPDIYLNATTTPESIIKITAYDTGAGTLDSVTIQLQPGMNCTMAMPPVCSESPFDVATDLGAISTTTTSGISLWRDDGDGVFNSGSDTLVSSTTPTQASAWATQVITDDWGSFTVSETAFSNLSLTLPTSFSNQLALFVVVRAEDNLDASPLHSFMPKIPQYGVNVTGGTLTDWPSMSMGQMFGMVTLGAEGSGDNMQFSAPLVISEIQIASSTAAVEFIEIYNKTSQSFDLFPANGVAGADAAIGSNLNLHIVDCTGGSCTGTTTNPTLTLTTNNDSGDDIPANGYFLISSTAWNTAHAGAFGTPDATYDADTFGMNANGGAYISASSTIDAMVIDKVGWGNQTQTLEGMAAVSPPANGSLERKAYPSSTGSSMIGIDASRGNSHDSNNNSGDFVTRANAGPQNSSSATESDTINSSERNIVINEILYNTATSTGWIELFNASSTAISINTWTLAIGTSTQTTYTLPNISMEGQSFVMVYWNQIGTLDDDTSDGLGAAYTGAIASVMSKVGGDVTLKNGGTIVDYVQYGGSGKAGSAAAAAAGQWTTGDFKPNCEYNESIARAGTAGDDHNTSGDWINMSTPTPGVPNMGGDATAPTDVTNVQLTDPDSTAFGLKGQDVQITWTPSSTSDPGFDRYNIYLLPDGTALNTSVHSVYNTFYGQYMWESGVKAATINFVGGGEAMSYDSAGTALSDGNYRAYVVAIDMAGNKSASVSSAAATLTAEGAGEAGADSMPPMIDHMPVWRAPVETGLTIYARMGDDRSLATAELAYKTAGPDTAWGNATSTCAAPAMAGSTGLYACAIAWDGGWDENTTLSYYLRAIDDTGNATYMGMYPSSTETTAQTDSINIDLILAASWNDAGTTADLSGTVFDMTGNPIQDAFIIIDGISTTTATTTSSGTFTIPDNAMPEGNQFIRIIKDGYMERITDTDANSSFIVRDASNLTFNISSGYMSNSAGGSSGGNGISWTAPGDNMMMAPTNISCTGDCSTIGAGEMPIMIGFFNSMNSTTIDDMDASNAGSNIYLTSDGVTKVSGIKVKYASGNNEARIYSSTALSPNTFYTVVVTPSVTDTNGNPIMSNRPSGNYEFSFSTMGDNSSMWGGGGDDYSNFGGGGMFMPPYVIGTNPTPGSYNIPLSTSISVEFSEAMDPTVTNAVKLYRITSVGSWTGTEVTTTASLDNATKKVVTLTPSSALNANASNSGWYEIRVLASAKSQLGTWMGDPSSCAGVSPDTCLANTTHYSSSFQVGSNSDTTAPTVAGTYPSNNDGITAGTTAIDVAIPSIEIGFSESMSPSSINSQNITLKKGTVSAAGTVKYDPMSNSAKFMPSSALTANSVYTLTVVGTGSSGVADMSGNYLAANSIISFKTGSADTSAPNVMFANGDDYQVAVTFSEPMNNAGQTDTANWTTSVLNPANYYVNSLQSDAVCATPGSWACSPTAQAPYNTVGGNQVSGLSNITLTYDSVSQTVTLKGFSMCGGSAFASCASNAFQIFVDNVTDKSNNALTDSGNRAGDPTHGNGVRAFLQNSAETYGMIGPGGGSGMMMGGGGPGGSGTGTGPGMDMGQMGMFKGGAFPMNAMAGQTSSYMLDIPVTKALQNGMLITVTFPTGFNVSGVAKDSYSPMNSDMNDWNSGTVTWDTSYGVGGIASTTNNTVTIKLDISGTVNSTAGPDGYIDFLHIDLKGIVNSSIPKDFGTSGYTADIKTKSADGALLENVSTMPFFITEGGSDSLVVTVNSGNASQNDGTMTVYLGSWMTGPMEADTTTFENGIGTSTFSNLVSGEYMIFTDPFITIGSNNYLGKPMPEMVQVSGATAKTITLESEGGGANKAAVYAVLNGDFSTNSVADDVDIFANSPTGFRVKTLSSLGSASNATTTMYFTEGRWSMGIGPAMPKGPMAGPPPMPDWMQPQMVEITVGIETATSQDLNPGGAGNAANGNNNPILLGMASTENFRVGDTVGFSNGAATSTISELINNVSITVAPAAGNWSATLPDNGTVVFSTRESSSTANDGAIRFDISTQSLKNIIGYVLDDAGSGVGNAEVYAYQPQGFGGGHTTTDTAGKFTLKIGNNGVWTIGAFKQGMPNSQDKSVEVKDNVDGNDGNTTAEVYLNGALISDVAGDNAGTNPLRLKLKRPSYTISGKVLNTAGQAVPSAPVWAYQPSSWGHADAMTDSSGNYILYVDAGTWRVETDAPGVGWMQYSPDVTITTASQSNINLRPDSDTNFYSVSGTITIDGSAQSYAPLRAVKYDANGNNLGRDFGASTDSNGLFTFSLPEGYYRIDTWTPSYGEVELVYDQVANSPANINVNAATTTANITVASVDLQTVSIQFTNGTAAQTGFLHIEEVDFSGTYPKPTGYRLDKKIDGLSATTTVKLKGASAGKYYFFDLDVSGLGFYMPDEVSRLLLSNTKDCIKLTDAARAVYFTLPNASTGVITVAGTVQDSDTNAVANAWVWLGNPNSNFHTGTETAADGTFTLTVPKLASGSYKLGADKPGYMSPTPATVSATAASAGNAITLASYSLSISGRVYADADSDGTYDSGEELPNGWVWAEETSTGVITHSPSDATGAYELGVTAGTWQVYAGTDGYTDSAYKISNTKTPVTVAAASVPNINVALTANANWTMKTKSKPITPSSGGTVDDTGASGTGVKLTVPPNALGSDSSSGNIAIQETSAVAETASAEPLGGTGKTIAATDNSGNAVTNLNDYIDVELVYYKADIEAMNVVDYSKLKNLSESYWDNTLNNWVNLSTTRKAYYKLLVSDTEWTLMTDSATQSGFEEFIDTLVAETPTYYDYKLVLTAKSNHLTVFGATMPQDGLLPAVPAGLSQSSGGGTSVGLSWTAVTTNSDDSAISDLLGYEVYRSTDGTTYTQRNTSDVSTNSYSDSTSAWTSYYYKITAADDGGNETALADSTALQVCSNKTVSNGTVSASCAITCNTGYTQNGNSCNASGGSVFIPGGGGGSSNTTAPADDTENTAEEETAAEDIVENITETVNEIIDTTKEAASDFAQKIVEITSEAAEVVKANINSLLGKFGFKRELAKEQVAVKKYVKELIKDVNGISKDSEYALTNFVAYGTPTTQILGEGERAGVVNSYKSAFGKLPNTEEEWNDIIKIGNGRWPSETNALSEANATEAFKKIYLREPDRTNPHDDAAVTVIAYGLRPTDRNLDSEKAAIKTFKAIYGYNPKSAVAWDIVRAIAYSGATR